MVPCFSLSGAIKTFVPGILGRVVIDTFVVVVVAKDALIVERLKSAIRARCPSSMSTFSCPTLAIANNRVAFAYRLQVAMDNLETSESYDNDSLKAMVQHQPSSSEDIAFPERFHGTFECQVK
jgi:hypothetical protein